MQRRQMDRVPSAGIRWPSFRSEDRRSRMQHNEERRRRVLWNWKIQMRLRGLGRTRTHQEPISIRGSCMWVQFASLELHFTAKVVGASAGCILRPFRGLNPSSSLSQISHSNSLFGSLGFRRLISRKNCVFCGKSPPVMWRVRFLRGFVPAKVSYFMLRPFLSLRSFRINIFHFVLFPLFFLYPRRGSR